VKRNCGELSPENLQCSSMKMAWVENLRHSRAKDEDICVHSYLAPQHVQYISGLLYMCENKQ